MRLSTVLAAAALVAAVAAPTSALAADVEGSTSGVFVNPQPSSAVVGGVGTSTFTHGDPASSGPPNTLIFTGTSFASALETPFNVGSLYYYNGSVFDSADSVDLSLSLQFTTPALGTVPNPFSFTIVSTDNTGSPDGDADYLYFPSSFSTSEFLIDGTTYRVQLTGFGNIVGDGFLDSDSSRLHVREGASARADLFAVVTSRTANSAVPEPATWAMMIAGFGAVGHALRRRRRTGAALPQRA